MAEVKEKWADTALRILYVLKLKDECFYIGQSLKDHYEMRIKKHFKGRGSSWTKLHRPIEVLEEISVDGTYRDIELKENQKTFEYMKKYGVKKVRGGFFSHTDEVQTIKGLKKHGYDIKLICKTEE